jgi:glycosyltransferase involved in cell wall biosynthesis
MKVGIYNSSRGPSGTMNASAAILASALVKRFDVDLIVNSTHKELPELGGRSLERVGFRTVDDLQQIVTDPGLPGRRYEWLRKWSDELTSRYDLFINFTDRLPIFCSAPKGILVVEHPQDYIPSIYRALWVQHLASYKLQLSSSYYTRFWTKLFWEIECSVVHPAVPFQPASSANKENLILAAGPIDRLHHQLELIAAFRQLQTEFPGWSLVVMGELDDSLANNRYFKRLKQAAEDSGVTILTNPSSEKKIEMFQRAKLLWHAVGLGSDLDLHPRKVEPFSIDVAQAMAAGCIPLATNSGSLSELMRHRVNGIFWETTAELREWTLLLAENETMSRSLKIAAQERAQAFSPEKFTDAFLHQLRDTFGIKSVSPLSPSFLWKRLVSSADQFLVARR